MKRNLLLLVACLLVSLQGFCQFGVKAGMNFNSLGDVKADYDKSSIANSLESAVQNKTGFHVGVLYKFQIPLVGVAVQPELIYSQTKGDVKLEYSGLSAMKSEVSVDYLQLPVSLQWGLDLILLRPFIQVVPYIGYCINKDTSIKDLKLKTNDFNYGVGLGAGLDVWKLQVSGRYCWDLGNMADYEWNGLSTLKGGKNKGFQLSLALFF
jgi:hypothetical protein